MVEHLLLTTLIAKSNFTVCIQNVFYPHSRRVDRRVQSGEWRTESEGKADSCKSSSESRVVSCQDSDCPRQVVAAFLILLGVFGS